MTEQYELYCLADERFYDRLDPRRAESPDFPISGTTVPEGWRHEASDTWMHFAPADGRVPLQGWKIHVSATVGEAERVLATVWDYCVARRLSFKFLRSAPVVVMLNSKSAARGSSGKLATLYPRDEQELERVLAELGAELQGVQGPYVLSDLRYGDGPLFVRYGGFVERRCIAANGERVLAIEDDTGTLVPDARGPTFALPPWVTLPAFLQPHLDARNAVTTAGLPYAIEQVLHFSNGGGVYLARDERDGAQVVLKEGRPHAGLDLLGRDAVARIDHERDMLERLAGLDEVPALRDHFTLGDHRFLVQEFIDGSPLSRLVVRRYPLTRPEPGEETLAEYADWALGMVDRVERAVAALHARGVVFGDLHPDNILVTPEGRMVLIDYEVATLAEDRARSALAHPGFGAPADRRGEEADRYALACLRIGMFAPQSTMMAPVHRAKAAHLAELVTETFPVPPDAMAHAVATILGPDADPVAMHELPMPGDAAWAELRAALRRAILASATPDRGDRLFPGDIAQFRPGGGLNMAHGAAGVLHALAVTGAGRFPAHEDWLRRRARDPEEGTGIGAYDGLLGVAVALEALGYPQDALDLAERCLRERWEALEPGLHSGIAGIGLSLLRLADGTGEAALADAGLRAAAIAAERLGGPEDVPELSGGSHPRAGLMHGSAGTALLLIHAYERTGDGALLDVAAVALRQDLRRCVRADDGTLQVNQGWRRLPYLDEGSAGISLVVARFLAHRDDDALAAALPALSAIARSGYFVQPGLFAGRAGLLATAASLGRGGAGARGPEIDALVRGMRWHAMPYAGGLAFPGDQLLRLSMDLATGTAGALLALGAALHDDPVSLPFLEPPAAPPAPRAGAGRASRGERSSPPERPAITSIREEVSER